MAGLVTLLRSVTTLYEWRLPTNIGSKVYRTDGPRKRRHQSRQ